MIHKAAGIRNGKMKFLTEVVACNIGDVAAALHHPVCIVDSAFRSAGDDDSVDFFVIGEFHDLCNDVAVFVVNDVGRTVLLCELLWQLPVPNGDQTSGTTDRRACNAHKADRADADHKDCITKLDICTLNSGKASGDHVADKAGSFNGNTIGNDC